MSQPLTLSLVLDADNKGLVGSVRVSKKELDKLTKSIDDTGDSSSRSRNKMGRFEKQTKDVGTASAKSKTSVRSFAKSFGGFAVASVAAATIAAFAAAAGGAIDTMQGMEAQLKTITGSWEGANVELERLIGFAKQTPYDLNQSVEAFAKLTHLGLDPSERAMKSYGNTASAMNKDLMQMIEAVADASVGEFERLKEFGIKASSQGDMVRMTFQGNTTEIKKDAKSIQEYLLALGENQFAGAMADQMQRLGARYSNFKMEVLQLTDAVGDRGLTAAMSGALDTASLLVGSIRELVISGEPLDELTIWAEQFNSTFNLLLGDFDIGRESVDSFASESIGSLGKLVDFWWSGMEGLVDIIKDFPAHWRTIWHIVIGEAEKGWENLKLGAMLFISFLDEGWENMAHGAGAAWLWVELSFASMMDGILSTMAESLTSMADTVSNLPYMDAEAAMINNAAASLRNMATAEGEVKAKIAESNAEHKNKLAILAQVRTLAATDNQQAIAEIDARIAKVIQERDVTIAASDSMREAAKQRREEEKKAREDAASDSRSSDSSPIDEFIYDDTSMKAMIKDVEKLGSSWNNTGSVVTQAFGSMAANIDALSNSQASYIKLEAEMGEQRKQIMKIDDLGERQKELKRLDKLETDVNDQRLSSTVGGFAAITGAASQMFDEQSKGREALHQMEQVFTIIEVGLAMQKASANAMAAVTSAFSAPWPIGFASGAAMIAIMAGLGVFSGSSGTAPESSADRQSGQGTGTVLGSDDKSESINNAYERIEDLELDQYAELQQMNRELRDLNSNITHLAANLVMQYGAFDGDNYDGFLGEMSNFSTGGFFEDLGESLGGFLGDPLGGLIDSIIGSFSKTKVSLLDSGLSFGTQNLGQMFESGMADLSIYNDIKTKESSWWGLSSSTSYSTKYEDVDAEVATEVARIFESIGGSVMSAVDVLGIDLAHTLESFEIDLPNLSFKDLSGEEIQKELEAVFSQQGDMIAKWVAPSMSEYQRVGEGLYDTLIRVAQEQAVFNAALEQSGLGLSRFGDVSSETQIAISQSIIGLMGGIETFKEATSTYFSEFFTEAEQFDYLQSQLTSQFEQLGYQLPENAEQMRSLVESLDLTTESGQEAYAALMRLVPGLAEYIDQLEQQQAAIDSFNNSIQSQLDTTGMEDQELELWNLDKWYADSLAQAEELGIDISALEELYGLKRTEILEKYLLAEADLLAQQQTVRDNFNQSISDQLTKMELSGQDLDIWELEKWYADTKATAEENGADMAMLEALYGKKRQDIAAQYIDAATADAERQLSALSSEFERAVDGLNNGFEQLSSSIDALTGDIANSVLSLKQTLPGFDNVAWYSGQVDSLSSQLGQGTAEEQLSTADSLKQAILDKYNAELANIQSLAGAADEANSAAQQHYQEQLSAIKSLNDAVKRLGDAADKMLIGDLSPLTAQEQLAEAKTQYTQLLAQAKAGDVDAIGQLESAGQSYLKLAQQYNPASYDGVFDSVYDAYKQVSGMTRAEPGAPAPHPDTYLAMEREEELTLATIAELEALGVLSEKLKDVASNELETATELLQQTFTDESQAIREALGLETVNITDKLDEQIQVLYQVQSGIVSAIASIEIPAPQPVVIEVPIAPPVMGEYPWHKQIVIDDPKPPMPEPTSSTKSQGNADIATAIEASDKRNVEALELVSRELNKLNRNIRDDRNGFTEKRRVQ
ncbi:hypothetical protein FM038_017140 [Shewanella eurypsychrophilus]|uniref:Bacteriophage tail tape measure N-terminal domain-containing protein n=1 Tax=Shewanella eurypsychrophilus TaxID=2593656 RepID=A0ABX6V8G2_9GAMM|nr:MULTISPECIES: hypothetical protein [Shewanella]QFU23725.1 hypothetical protein FS418_18930 [Shewanella sp. YLB-09]QPG58945.1 hypothetical protein FM038_017140 [Shewanella eurypsychrophilus]